MVVIVANVVHLIGGFAAQLALMAVALQHGAADPIPGTGKPVMTVRTGPWLLGVRRAG